MPLLLYGDIKAALRGYIWSGAPMKLSDRRRFIFSAVGNVGNDHLTMQSALRYSLLYVAEEIVKLNGQWGNLMPTYKKGVIINILMISD